MVIVTVTKEQFDRLWFIMKPEHRYMEPGIIHPNLRLRDGEVIVMVHDDLRTIRFPEGEPIGISRLMQLAFDEAAK